MPPSRPNDQSLLDRLNALKPTSVTLDKPANTSILPETDAQPVSKEDALAARLRTLRSQPSNSSRGGAAPNTETRPEQPGRSAGVGAPPPVEPPALGGPSPKEKVASPSSSASPAGPRYITQKRPSYRFVDPQADDEDAVDELLEALGDEDFMLAADEDAEGPPDFDPSDEAERVAGLLESLQKGTGNITSKGSDGPAEDDYDSDGEQMTSAVETLLSQIRDEISSLPPPAATSAENDNHATGQQPRSAERANDAGADERDHDTDEPPFTLPAVPSQLVDPVPGPNSGEDDFEKDISARMAALGGLSSLDALGLPSAPTFRPQDHSPSSTFGKGLLRSSKYTDEDQKTWCVVCLEDATIECIGCERDVYCARCWKEMHVGPSAGYDERGHQWVKFERAAHP